MISNYREAPYDSEMKIFKKHNVASVYGINSKRLQRKIICIQEEKLMNDVYKVCPVYNNNLITLRQTTLGDAYEIRQYKELKDQGNVTEEEFEKIKK